MKGIDRLLPNANTANKALEQKQNIYFAFAVKHSFSCHVFFVVQGVQSFYRYNFEKIG